MIDIDLVCPIYKGYRYLDALYNSVMNQKNVNIKRIVFPVTNSNDKEMDDIISFIEEHNIIYFVEDKTTFSHSLTRQKAMIEYCDSDIVVMISQDIKIDRDDVFYNLTKDIANKKTVYNYARQICNNKTIEKYIRKKNYPEESYYVDQSDIDEMQIMAFFASDACSAYDRNVFVALGGYGGYDVMMSEDMLYSKIILDAGYSKKYCSDAVVEHSHKYTLKQLYERYFETGRFYKKVKLFDKYNSTNSGFSLALYVLKEALKKFDILTILRWLPDMTARYLGMKRGKR